VLNVDPEGTVTLTFSNPTVISIPDANTTGIESTLAVPDSLSILSTTVGVNITHTYIGDLEVSVVSPAGTSSILHNRTGGSADNINQSFQSAAFNGQNSTGTWRLRVRDLTSVDIGTLDRWTLTLKGAPTTPPPPDTSAPTVLLTSPASGATVSGSVAVSATASDNVAVREVRFFVDGAPLATHSTSPYSATWDSSTASAGSHVVAAQATDTSGNNSSLSQVTVTVASDTTPPVISNVAASSITGSSATLSWSTNEPADSQVQYGTTTAYGSTTPLALALVTSRSVQLSGLARNTLYNYRVKSVDAAGNVSWSGNFTFRTAKR
jgi:serine protease